MRIRNFLLPIILATLTIGSASAATYKVSVKSSLNRFVFGQYFLNGDYEAADTYFVTGINDPVLENYPYQSIIDFAYAYNGGSARFTEIYYGPGSSDWRGSDCTGVLSSFCGGASYGRLTGSFIDITRSNSFCCSFYQINSEQGIIAKDSDDIEYWTNDLGEHQYYGGEGVTHVIEGISISPVPVPASGILLLLSLAGFGGARMMRRR